MEIRRLAWDAANRRELAYHRITTEEVDGLIALDEWAADVHADYPGQVRVTGRTPQGRWLTIAMEPTADAVVWRPITGWEATPAEKAYYWDQ
jgi:hypothetical protein